MANENRADTLNIPGYELIRLIGQGGMGAVYLAMQLSLGRPVAVKLLSLAPKSDPAEQAARFRREAELMARIHHPNVVAVHDFGTLEGRPFLVMEYVEGGDLRQRMEPGQPLPVAQVRPLVLPVARALACLHSHGILHRDLKPENILMEHGVTPKLTDFGLAVLDSEVGTLTQAGGALGTIGYVSPEQQYRLGVDERADQYSMAALLYELLSGHRPLGILKPPSALVPGLSLDVDAVILRALQDDPDDRYPNILEFGEALDRVLASPAARPDQRRRRTAMAVVTIMVALAAVAAGVWASRDRAVVKERGPTARASPNPALAPLPALAPVAVAAAPAVAPVNPPPPRLIDTLGITLVLIPAGEFLMGSPDTDSTAKDEEKPRHPVRISHPFYLGTTEVTVGQFRAFVEATGYQTEAESSGEGGTIYRSARKVFEPIPSLTWRNPGLPVPQTEDEPVVQVSWNDADAFCRWLTQREARTYRLPTEAEWEYACRAGSTTHWSMGDDPQALEAYAWVHDPKGDSTHPVGTKKPNAYGLYDMHGNVWEWCLDWLGPYSDAAAVDPIGPATAKLRALRGGACIRGESARTRSASRLSRKPSFRFLKYGFRVCCPLAEKVVGE